MLDYYSTDMDEITKFIDTLLVNIALYPATLWKIVFSPSSVFSAINAGNISAPSITFLFSIAFPYFIIKAINTGKSETPSAILNTRTFLIGAAVYVGIVVNLQRWAIILVGDVTTAALDVQLHALLYAVCPIIILVSVISILENILKRIHISFILVVVVVTNAVYLWCLFNVCHITLGFLTRRAIYGALLAYLCIIGVGLLFGFFLLLYWRRNQSNKLLQSTPKSGTTER